MGCSKSSFKREVYSNECLHIYKNSSNNLTVLLKKIEKEKHIKPKLSRRKKIINITAEISETETVKTIQQMNETEFL